MARGFPESTARVDVAEYPKGLRAGQVARTPHQHLIQLIPHHPPFVVLLRHCPLHHPQYHSHTDRLLLLWRLWLSVLLLLPARTDGLYYVEDDYGDDDYGLAVVDSGVFVVAHSVAAGGADAEAEVADGGEWGRTLVSWVVAVEEGVGYAAARQFLLLRVPRYL